jgi:hypothetical protein
MRGGVLCACRSLQISEELVHVSRYHILFLEIVHRPESEVIQNGLLMIHFK